MVCRMEDIKIRTRIGRTIPTGIYETTRIGTQRQKNRYQEMFDTVIGEFVPDKWYEIALMCIRESGSEKLFVRIVDYCTSHCAWLKTEDERKKYAMNILLGRNYRHWKDFSVAGLTENTAFIFRL